MIFFSKVQYPQAVILSRSHSNYLLYLRKSRPTFLRILISFNVTKILTPRTIFLCLWELIFLASIPSCREQGIFSSTNFRSKMCLYIMQRYAEKLFCHSNHYYRELHQRHPGSGAKSPLWKILEQNGPSGRRGTGK